MADGRLLWILGGGLGMVVVALAGGLLLFLPERTLRRLLFPLVALTAGTLLGASLLHLLPGAVERQPGVGPWAWATGGFLATFAFEQGLRQVLGVQDVALRPRGAVASFAFESFVGGLVVGAAFVVDLALGIGAWVVVAAHEVPEDLEDLAALVRGGWPKRKAFLWNVGAAAAFPVGALAAWAASLRFDVGVLVPLGAGIFLYVASADLVPEVSEARSWRKRALHLAALAAGVGVVGGVRFALERLL